MKSIRIKYFSEDYPRVEKIEQGDWVDLRVGTILKHNGVDIEGCNISRGEINSIAYKEGDILLLGLGVAMELPKGYEAHLLPRSSTFKKTGLTLTNSMGIIDHAYKGDNDEWMVMVVAHKSGEIHRHDRLFQFRIVENQPKLDFVEVDKLENEDRGGFGSTDK